MITWQSRGPAQGFVVSGLKPEERSNSEDEEEAAPGNSSPAQGLVLG